MELHCPSQCIPLHVSRFGCIRVKNFAVGPWLTLSRLDRHRDRASPSQHASTSTLGSTRNASLLRSETQVVFVLCDHVGPGRLRPTPSSVPNPQSAVAHLTKLCPGSSWTDFLMWKLQYSPHEAAQLRAVTDTRVLRVDAVVPLSIGNLVIRHMFYILTLVCAPFYHKICFGSPSVAASSFAGRLFACALPCSGSFLKVVLN